ncbi:hypothetical protein TNCV_5025121 [Trichonephila clavipes]|nr:hypothetical protein TNCV_5025121 [Trichonephila clavipes]
MFALKDLILYKFAGVQSPPVGFVQKAAEWDTSSVLFSSFDRDSNDEVRLPNYTRAFGDGPRHFEPWSWSSDEDDTLAGTPTTTPHQREDV